MGWITTFYMEHNWLLTLFSEELQDEVFGAQPFVLAPGSVNPSGRALPNGDGTYALSGHWQFGTGICHADWVLAERARSRATHPTRPAASCCARRRRRGQGHLARRRHGGDRQPRHRGHRRRRARAAGVADAAAPRCSPSRATRTCTRIPIAPFLSLTAAMPAIGAAKRALAAVRGALVRPGDVRHQADAERTGCRRRSASPTCASRSTRRDADAGHRGRMQAHADGVIDLDLAGAAAPPPGHRPRRAALPRRGAGDHGSRAVRPPTTSTTSCSGSTATST